MVHFGLKFGPTRIQIKNCFLKIYKLYAINPIFFSAPTQHKIIHILLEHGAKNVFCCLAARQYIKEPNYEKEFIGWVIRTYYKIKKEQNPDDDDVTGAFSEIFDANFPVANF